MQKPLEDLLVVDFSQAIAGPFCTMMMADNGARVIKVERAGSGDIWRDSGPADKQGNSLYFAAANRGKQSLELDLKSDADVVFAKRLIAKADILVENFRPGTMEKLGLGYESVQSINPKLLYVSISGFGQTGPMRDEPGFDMIAQGYSGIMSINGPLHGDATRVGVAIGDLQAAQYAYMATMTALHACDRTGQGSHIDVALTDSLFSLLLFQVPNYFENGVVDDPYGNSHPTMAPYGVIPTKDGQIIVAVAGDRLWQRFCQALEAPEMQHDPRFKTNADRIKNREAFRSLERPILKSKTTEQWLSIFHDLGIPAAQLNNVEQACAMEQFLARNMIIESGEYRMAGNPMKFSGVDDATVVPEAPRLGQHNQLIRSEFS